MPLSDQYHRLPVDQIIIDRESRQRRTIETADLERSIAKLGVLQPIIIDRELKLIAGERRLSASKALGLSDIPCRFADELTTLEASIIELEENIKRKDLPWQDLVAATAKVHNLYSSIEPSWTQQKTADALAITQGTINLYLTVADKLEDPKIAECETVRQAYSVIQIPLQRAKAEALDELLGEGPVSYAAPMALAAPGAAHDALLNGGPPVSIARPLHSPTPPDLTIINRSFLEWAPSYSGPKFNLIHCDFPYGQNEFGGPEMKKSAQRASGGYESEESTFDQLLDCLCANFDRLMSVAGHLMFWYSANPILQSKVIEKFNSLCPSLEFQKFPLIWTKSDNKGLVPDATRTPRHGYEACLFASRGNRSIVRVVGDFYSCPTDNKFHPSTKPEPMLKHFFSMLVDETTSLLDPTCGSGSSIRAAEFLGAKRTLGLEINEQITMDSRRSLRTARVLKSASEQVS